MARVPGLEERFEGRRLDREIIILCVRWYTLAAIALAVVLGRTRASRSWWCWR
jgi:hypothetical protein